MSRLYLFNLLLPPPPVLLPYSASDIELVGGTCPQISGSGGTGSHNTFYRDTLKKIPGTSQGNSLPLAPIANHHHYYFGFCLISLFPRDRYDIHWSLMNIIRIRIHIAPGQSGSLDGFPEKNDFRYCWYDIV